MRTLAPERPARPHAQHLNSYMRLMQESHIEDYLFIGGDQMPAQDAAQRLGLSERTVYRYRAILRRRAQELAE